MESREKHEQQLDRWIDAALKTRASSEPLAGFEERLLERVAEARRQAPARRVIPWPWLAVAAAAAVLALVAGIALLIAPNVIRQNKAKPAEQVKTPHNVTPTAPAPSPKEYRPVQQPAPRVHQPRTVMAAARQVVEPPVPKLASFPAPSPLTAEEAQILRMSQRRQPALAYMRLRTQEEIEAEDAVNQTETLQELRGVNPNSIRDSKR
jgi:hypothetical protein